MVERDSQNKHDGEPSRLRGADLVEHRRLGLVVPEVVAVPVALMRVDRYLDGVHTNRAQRIDPVVVVRFVDLDPAEIELRRGGRDGHDERREKRDDADPHDPVHAGGAPLHRHSLGRGGITRNPRGDIPEPGG